MQRLARRVFQRNIHRVQVEAGGGQTVAQSIQGPGQIQPQDILFQHPSAIQGSRVRVLFQHRFRQPLKGVLQALAQHLGVQGGLQDVIRSPIEQGPAHIIEFVVSAQHQNFNGRVELVDQRDKINAVHQRHHHIAKHNLGMQRLDLGQRLLSVGGFSNDAKPFFLPGNHVAQTLAHDVFVVHNQNVDHLEILNLYRIRMYATLFLVHPV